MKTNVFYNVDIQNGIGWSGPQGPSNPPNSQRIPWALAHESVDSMQQQIVVAYKNQNLQLVNELQWKLVKSFAACRIAVKKVTSNPGKSTPGLDGEIWNEPQLRMDRTMQLFQLDWSSYKAQPVRRVWIPKPNGKKRPLGIPTMFDRTVQTVWALALLPIAECTRERNSYGYRPHRSAKDASQALYLRLGQKYGPLWVLEADIQGFYDNLNHQWMLEHIPIDTYVLHEWLKAGILEKGQFVDSESGVPQGGPISPVIANMCLDGLEQCVLDAVKQTKDKNWAPKVTTVRYADDFVITGATPRLQKYKVKPAVEKFFEGARAATPP